MIILPSISDIYISDQLMMSLIKQVMANINNNKKKNLIGIVVVRKHKLH